LRPLVPHPYGAKQILQEVLFRIGGDAKIIQLTASDIADWTNRDGPVALHIAEHLMPV